MATKKLSIIRSIFVISLIGAIVIGVFHTVLSRPLDTLFHANDSCENVQFGDCLGRGLASQFIITGAIVLLVLTAIITGIWLLVLTRNQKHPS